LEDCSYNIIKTIRRQGKSTTMWQLFWVIFKVSCLANMLTIRLSGEIGCMKDVQLICPNIAI